MSPLSWRSRWCRQCKHEQPGRKAFPMHLSYLNKKRLKSTIIITRKQPKKEKKEKKEKEKVSYQSGAYQHQRRWASCWYGWRGRGGCGPSCGRCPCLRTSGGTCWRRYGRPRVPRTRSGGTGSWSSAHTRGTPRRCPSSGLGRRFYSKKSKWVLRCDVMNGKRKRRKGKVCSLCSLKGGKRRKCWQTWS